jgi:hypothetical protein
MWFTSPLHCAQDCGFPIFLYDTILLAPNAAAQPLPEAEAKRKL